MSPALESGDVIRSPALESGDVIRPPALSPQRYSPETKRRKEESPGALVISHTHRGTADVAGQTIDVTAAAEAPSSLHYSHVNDPFLPPPIGELPSSPKFHGMKRQGERHDEEFTFPDNTGSRVAHRAKWHKQNSNSSSVP